MMSSLLEQYRGWSIGDADLRRVLGIGHAIFLLPTPVLIPVIVEKPLAILPFRSDSLKHAALRVQKESV